MTATRRWPGVLLLAVSAACSAPPAPADPGALGNGPGDVDRTRAEGADADAGNWLLHGRTYDEQRFSPLEMISAGNVATLGLAWHHDFDTKRGLEATPLVVDGVLYATGSWSRVYAFDARSGRLLWSHDPKVPGAWAVHACCDVVNRGVAAWNGKV